MDKTKIEYYDDSGVVKAEQDVSYWDASNNDVPAICITHELDDGSFWQILLPLDVVSKMVDGYRNGKELERLGLHK